MSNDKYVLIDTRPSANDMVYYKYSEPNTLYSVLSYIFSVPYVIGIHVGHKLH